LSPAALPDTPPSIVHSPGRATVQEALRKETFVFQARRSSLEGQIRLLRDQAQETEREEVALQDALASGAESIRLAKEELELNESLRKGRPTNREAPNALVGRASARRERPPHLSA
jgi:chromosome segregation ATPase